MEVKIFVMIEVINIEIEIRKSRNEINSINTE